MIPGLQAGRWDLINTGIFWTEERAKMMPMINYESQAISISVSKGNPLKITKPRTCRAARSASSWAASRSASCANSTRC